MLLITDDVDFAVVSIASEIAKELQSNPFVEEHAGFVACPVGRHWAI
jgi:hypothetical protein